MIKNNKLLLKALRTEGIEMAGEMVKKNKKTTGYKREGLSWEMI